MSRRPPYHFNRTGRYRYRGAVARAAVLARVLLTVRCQRCLGVYERPLDAIGEPCPVCQRYPEAVA